MKNSVTNIDAAKFSVSNVGTSEALVLLPDVVVLVLTVKAVYSRWENVRLVFQSCNFTSYVDLL